MWSYWADLTRATETQPNLIWLKYLIKLIRVCNEFRIVHGYGVFPRNKLELIRLKHRIELTWDQGTFKIEKLKCSRLCHYTSCNYRKNYFFNLVPLLMSFISS